VKNKKAANKQVNRRKNRVIFSIQITPGIHFLAIIDYINILSAETYGAETYGFRTFPQCISFWLYSLKFLIVINIGEWLV
jgi:hypothetical protein